MSVLELKSELHEIIVMLQSEEALLKILESAKQAVEDEDLWDLLSTSQVEKLKQSIENSRDKNQLLNHEDVKKKHAKWLSK